jgi:acyl-CoA synthetase (AMP-forming)/AMP-acid ligase II
MVETCATVERPPAQRLNVADRLQEIAAQMPHAIAVSCPQNWSPAYKSARQGNSGARYATTTFAELDADATRLARGLAVWGVPPGTRLALLVRPGIEFVTLVFALLRAGMVTILVDPGLGRRNLVRCLEEAEPEGFVAISLAQAARVLLRGKFTRARWNVTVGRRWFWGGLTLNELRMLDSRSSMLDIEHPASSIQHPATRPDDPAAIIFTSGSTGPPKGVLYTQRMFDTQVSEIQSMYDIEPGAVDLGCFPLFALFNSAMGVTTVFPEMDFSRPATANPKKLLAAANDWHVTQAFASPAVWRVVGDHCEKTGERIESLRQVFSCGAPVPASVLRKTLACVANDAKMHTPYGATECLPVSTIEASEVLAETAAKTDEGAGVCVGRKFDSIDWRVIRITDEPIATIDEAEELPVGEIGELMVRGPQISPRYVTGTEANGLSKIAGSSTQYSVLSTPATEAACCDGLSNTTAAWHRIGDVGYLDEQGRFWYCGRKSQRVETSDGPIFAECVEGVINTHPHVRRSALVGVGKPGEQLPVVVFEHDFGSFLWATDWDDELFELARRYPQSSTIQKFMPHDGLPVDVRHNAKINREQLAAWAESRLKKHLAHPPASSM